MSDLEARAAIADLVHGYARNIRAGRPEECGALFTSDAVFETRDAPLGRREPPRTRSRLEGRESIVAYLAHGASGDTRVCPMIHNLMIEVNGREAKSDCVMEAIVSNGMTLFGEYHDRFRIEDGGWRFSSRLFNIFGEFAPPARA